MKKIFAILAVFLIACLTFVGCTEENNTPSGTGNSTTNETEQTGGSTPNENEQEEISKMYITINGNNLEVTLEDNSSVDALVQRLKQGDITYTANDYGDFEKVGSLGFGLPTDDTQITTQAGDVILYSGNQIVLFYGSNTWSYTRLGKINGYSASELRTLLGAGKGSLQVTLSLKNG